MRKTKIIFSFLLFIGILGFLNSSELNQVKANEWFSSYNLKTSWNDERALLHNFAFYLKENPNLIGYIAFYTGETDTSEKSRFRVNRAKQYLVSKLKIDKNRIVIVNAGKTLNESKIILQPKLKGFPPPNF